MVVSRLKDIETSQRRGMVMGDVSDHKEEGEEENPLKEEEEELDPKE